MSICRQVGILVIYYICRERFRGDTRALLINRRLASSDTNDMMDRFELRISRFSVFSMDSTEEERKLLRRCRSHSLASDRKY